MYDLCIYVFILGFSNSTARTKPCSGYFLAPQISVRVAKRTFYRLCSAEIKFEHLNPNNKHHTFRFSEVGVFVRKDVVLSSE